MLYLRLRHASWRIHRYSPHIYITLFYFRIIAYSLNLYLKVSIFDTLRTFYSLGRTKIVCGSVPAYSLGVLKPRQVTPIVQPDEPAVTCNDRAIYEYKYLPNAYVTYSRKIIYDWAECVGLISEYQKYQLIEENTVISRGQFVEYLYRLSGSPEVKNLPAQSPYGDIKTDDPRFPVVMWARQRGITWGWSDGNFHYDAPAGEKTTVLMAYRLAGSPKVKLQDKSSILAPETWETYYPNMPHGSELHYAYTWALYGSWDLEQDAKYLTYRGIGLANKAPYWDSMWTHDATYEQAFEVLRLADTRGIF